ncbi:MAG: glycine cleavage system protein T [Anaerolineae bacterium]|nr:glycine cleavage system protein T [Anaerolineae bacterium]
MTMKATMGSTMTNYEGALLADRSDLGVLQITGATRLDLLNRMSTQDLRSLQAGMGAATVLTTDIGRIIDRLLLSVDTDSVTVITGENNGDNIARYLLRFVFFNDDFQLVDQSVATFVWAIYGPESATVLAAANLPGSDLPRYHWRSATIDGTVVSIQRTDPIDGDGFLIWGPLEHQAAVGTALQQAGSELISAETFDAIRIATGMPRFGRELTGEYIPLEANLWDDVSFSKGCYTGQEIIARMESRGRLAKKLVQLRADEPVAAGDNISAEGKRVGSITSAARIESITYALGYVKTNALSDPDTRLFAGETPLTLISESH